jgi:glycerol-1-phosphate dehydrogenase [NAD(P)+]
MELHFSPRIIEIGKGKGKEMPVLIKKFFGDRKIGVITGGNRVKEIAYNIISHFDFRIITIFLEDDLSEDFIEIEESIAEENLELIIGVGGGSILDTAKLIAYHTKIPFISFPTTLSNDGIYSPVVARKNNEKLQREWTPLPEGIIIDTDIIKNAPYNTILAGIGDLVANLSAVQDWSIASVSIGEEINYEAMYLSKGASEKFMYYVLTQNYNKNSLLENLAESLIMSGISMAVAGSSRPASGSEHLISHCLDRIMEKPLMHGIQTGISTVFTHPSESQSSKAIA